MIALDKCYLSLRFDDDLILGSLCRLIRQRGKRDFTSRWHGQEACMLFLWPSLRSEAAAPFGDWPR
jgi:hypothetical protein